MTTEQFIARAKLVHGDKYDYSHVTYVNARTKVEIICPIHGAFYQVAFSHLHGMGCRKCGRMLFSERTRFWTKEKCFEEGKKYRTKADFKRGNPSAYQLSYKRGWIQDMTWFESGYTIYGEKETKWTKEACEKEAKKYTTKKDFRNAPGWAYNTSVINGWINDYYWLKDERLDIKGKIDSVYVYLFEEQKAAYVGRTLIKRQKERDQEHIFQTHKDAVADYAKQNNLAVPPMVILETNLTLKEGQEREHFWVHWYQEQGYNILNKAKTGLGIGSLGGLGQGKWNKETCFAEAKKYQFLKDFRTIAAGAYTRALKEGWLKEYTWLKNGNKCAHEERRKWTYDTCKNEAAKYKTRTEFKKSNPSAFNACYVHKWLDDFFVPTNYKFVKYWNYERCYEEAKKYQTASQFARSKGESYAYKLACKNGWQKDYTWFEDSIKEAISKRVKWTYEACRTEAMKYKTRKEFRLGCEVAYNKSKKEGWLMHFGWLDYRPIISWTYELCREESLKYKNRSSFKAGSYGAYKTSYKNGWIEEFFPHKDKR